MTSRIRISRAALMISGALAVVSPARAEDIALGEYLSGQCTTCHQLSGANKGIPSIVGWDQESFISALKAYKKKERENKVMQNITNALSNQDVAALAAYFATIKPQQD